MTQTNIYKSLKKKKSWVKVTTINGREHCGQIFAILKSCIILQYHRKVYEKGFDLTMLIKRSQIENIEFLTCKNSKVWTRGEY